MPRTAGATTRIYVPITLDQVKGATVASVDELAKLAPKSVVREAQPRTDVMLALDELVKRSYAFWSEHGQPAPFSNEFPPVKVPVQDADQALTARFLLRKSADFLNHGIRFGTDNPTVDGRVIVSFCALDKKARKPKNASANGTSA